MGNEKREALRIRLEHMRKHIENAISDLEKFSRVEQDYIETLKNLAAKNPEIQPLYSEVQQDKNDRSEFQYSEVVNRGKNALAKFDTWVKNGCPAKGYREIVNSYGSFHEGLKNTVAYNIDTEHRNTGSYLKEAANLTKHNKYENNIGAHMAVVLNATDMQMHASKLDLLEHDIIFTSLTKDVPALINDAEAEKIAEEKELAEKTDKEKKEKEERERAEQAAADEERKDEKQREESFLIWEINDIPEVEPLQEEEIEKTADRQNEEQAYSDELQKIKNAIDEEVKNNIIPNVKQNVQNELDYDNKIDEFDEEIESCKNQIELDLSSIAETEVQLNQYQMQLDDKKRSFNELGIKIDDLMNDLDLFNYSYGIIAKDVDLSGSFSGFAKINAIKNIISGLRKDLGNETIQKNIAHSLDDLNRQLKQFVQDGNIDYTGNSMESLDDYTKLLEKAHVDHEQKLAVANKAYKGAILTKTKNKADKDIAAARANIKGDYFNKIVAREFFFILRKHNIDGIVEQLNAEPDDLSKKVDDAKSKLARQKNDLSMHESNLLNAKNQKKDILEEYAKKVRKGIQEQANELYNQEVEKLDNRSILESSERAEKYNKDVLDELKKEKDKLDELRKEKAEREKALKSEEPKPEEVKPEEPKIPVDTGNILNELDNNEILAMEMLGQEVESPLFKSDSERQDAKLFSEIALHVDEEQPEINEEPQPEVNEEPLTIREEDPQPVVLRTVINEKPYMEELQRLYQSLEKTVGFFQRNSKPFLNLRAELTKLTDKKTFTDKNISISDFGKKMEKIKKCCLDYATEHKNTEKYPKLHGNMPQRLKIMSRIMNVLQMADKGIDPKSPEGQRLMLREKYLNAKWLKNLTVTDRESMFRAEAARDDLIKFRSTMDKCANFDKKVDEYINTLKDEELLEKLQMHGEDFYNEAAAGLKNLEQKQDRIMNSILNPQNNVSNPQPQANNKIVIESDEIAQDLLSKELSPQQNLQANNNEINVRKNRMLRAQKIMGKLKKQLSLFNKYVNNGFPREKMCPFERLAMTLLDVSGTSEAEQKNIKLLTTLQTPEGQAEYLKMGVNAVFNLDVKKLISTDPDELLDYAENNWTALSFAFDPSYVAYNENVDPEMKRIYQSCAGLIQEAGKVKDIISSMTTEEYEKGTFDNMSYQEFMNYTYVQHPDIYIQNNISGPNKSKGRMTLVQGLGFLAERKERYIGSEQKLKDAGFTGSTVKDFANVKYTNPEGIEQKPGKAIDDILDGKGIIGVSRTQAEKENLDKLLNCPAKDKSIYKNAQPQL